MPANLFRFGAPAILVCAIFTSCVDFTRLRVSQDERVPLGRVLPPNDLSWVHPAKVPSPRLTVVDFWATWCKPCLAEMPRLEALQREWQGRGVSVIGVSNEPRETIEAFLKAHPFDYGIAAEGDDGYWKRFDIQVIPYVVIVDANGAVAWRGHPENLNGEVLAPLLEH